MKKVTFLTGNKGKWEIAKSIFADYGIELLQDKIETPEIQTLSVEEVAKFSVSYAVEKTGLNVMVSDVGHYIPALGGFPGPFIKFINQTLTPEDVLALMQGKQDRRVILRECFAYAEPNQEPVTFISEQQALIANLPEGEGSTIDRLLILEGFDRPKGTYSSDVIFEHWKNSLGGYHDLAKHICGR